MPIVTEILRADHRKVERLFGEYEEAEDREIAMEICRELTVHSLAEEELVYPDLKRLDSEQERHAEEEHGEAKTLITQAQASRDEDLPALMAKLKQAILHHVEEEEGKAFPLMEERIAGDRLRELGEQVTDRKAQLMALGTIDLTDTTRAKRTATKTKPKAKASGTRARTATKSKTATTRTKTKPKAKTRGARS